MPLRAPSCHGSRRSAAEGLRGAGTAQLRIILSAFANWAAVPLVGATTSGPGAGPGGVPVKATGADRRPRVASPGDAWSDGSSEDEDGEKEPCEDVEPPGFLFPSSRPVGAVCKVPSSKREYVRVAAQKLGVCLEPEGPAVVHSHALKRLQGISGGELALVFRLGIPRWTVATSGLLAWVALKLTEAKVPWGQEEEGSRVLRGLLPVNWWTFVGRTFITADALCVHLDNLNRAYDDIFTKDGDAVTREFNHLLATFKREVHSLTVPVFCAKWSAFATTYNDNLESTLYEAVRGDRHSVIDIDAGSGVARLRAVAVNSMAISWHAAQPGSVRSETTVRQHERRDGAGGYPVKGAKHQVRQQGVKRAGRPAIVPDDEEAEAPPTKRTGGSTPAATGGGAGRGGYAKADPAARGSKPCYRFAVGTCTYGDACQFSHDPAKRRKFLAEAAAAADASGAKEGEASG
jgi:hypothetical protein